MKRTANTKAKTRLELTKEKVKELSVRDLSAAGGGHDVGSQRSGVCPTHA
jgi:hypothetical protein